MSKPKPENGTLRVWWIPQVGKCKTFYYPVTNIVEGKILLDCLAKYDLFQLANNIKPDFSNAGGLEVWDEGLIDEEDPNSDGWTDWGYDDKDGDFYESIDELSLEEVRELQKRIDHNNSMATNLVKFAKERESEIELSKNPYPFAN